MTADKMFEELGYTVVEKTRTSYIYEKELYENGHLQYELYIVFELKDKEFYKTNSSWKDIENITISELKAINEKVLELRVGGK